MSIEISRHWPPLAPLGSPVLERMEARPTIELSLPTSSRDLALILFKWKWSILVILATGLLGTVFWLWVVRDNVYEVSSKILVKIGHEQTSSTASLSDRPIPVIGQRAQDVNSEVDILRNKELVGQVIDELHMDVPGPPLPYPPDRLGRLRWHVKDLSARFREWQNELFITLGLRPRLTYRERVLSLLSDGLIVTAQRDSNVIVAQMFVGVREGGSVILNALVDKYLNYRLALWRGQGADEFFEGERDRSRDELRVAEAAVADFEQSHNIVALQKQQEVLVASIADEEEQLRRAGIAMDEANAKLARVTAELGKPDPDFAALGEFPQGSFSDAIMQQLSGLERQREQLRMTELDDSIKLKNLRAQFAGLLQDVVSNVAATATERRAAFDARNAAVTRMRGELQNLHAQEVQWTDLKRRVNLTEQNFLNYQSRVREVTGLSELESRHVGNVVVIERATDALTPAGTRKQTLLAAAMAVVLFVAFVFVAVGEFFDHRIYTPETLESLVGAPTIGTIPNARRARLRYTLPPPPAAATALRI